MTTSMTTWARWRGLKALVQDLVENGSRAVERVHKETAARSFTVLELIPPIAEPARQVHAIHDASVSGVYAAIRGVNRLVGATLDVVLTAAEGGEQHREPSGSASERVADSGS